MDELNAPGTPQTTFFDPPLTESIYYAQMASDQSNLTQMPVTGNNPMDHMDNFQKEMYKINMGRYGIYLPEIGLTLSSHCIAFFLAFHKEMYEKTMGKKGIQLPTLYVCIPGIKLALVYGSPW